jgi:DNA-3-methyladenine glycosylase II
MPHIIHLQKDKKLAKLIATQQPFILSKRKNVYLHLCNSIMSQQLSTKVADVFQQRFLNLYNNKIPTAQQIADTPFETLRSIGLSNAKANYILNVCNFFIAKKITDAALYKMPSDEIIQLLTQIKGVGRWTVEMILMFTLGREDVFAVDDLVIQQSMCAVYKIDATDKKSMKIKMQSIAAKWHPYQTYACRYLWGHKDGG